jgi:hypothetical protein
MIPSILQSGPFSQVPAASIPEQLSIKAYGENQEMEAGKSLTGNDLDAQLAFVRNQKKMLEKESSTLFAAGKDTDYISHRIDFLIGEYGIQAKENIAVLKAATERRKTEQAARHNLSLRMTQERLKAKEQDLKYQISGDSRMKIIQDAKYDLQDRAENVPSDKRFECKKIAREFGAQLDTSLKDHETKSLPPRISEGFLQERKALYDSSFDRQCPKMTPAQKNIESAIYSMKFDLPRVPEGQKRLCERKIEGFERNLEAMKNGLEGMHYSPGETGNLVQQQGRVYHDQFRKECLNKAIN